MTPRNSTRNKTKVSAMSEEQSPARDEQARDWSTATPAQRSAEASRLYMVGFTYQEIADRLGYANHTGAYKAVQRALVDEVDKRAQPNDLLRVVENARLDLLIKKALEVMTTLHYATNNNGIIYRPADEDGFLRDEETGAIQMDEHGNYLTANVLPLHDDGPALDAIKTVLKIMERKAKMNGLDAPSRREVITLDAIEAEIQRIEQMANRR